MSIPRPGFVDGPWPRSRQDRRPRLARRARRALSRRTPSLKSATPPSELPVTDPIGLDPHGIARGLTNYGDPDFALYLRRSFAKSMGYSDEILAQPVVGIVNTASGFNNCHRQVPELIEAVKRGVLAAGGLPMVFPTISLGE